MTQSSDSVDRQSSDVAPRDYIAFLASQRSKLLTPVHTILDTAERMLLDGGDEFPDSFASDVKNVVQLSTELKDVFHEVLNPNDAQQKEFTEELRSRVRHDILNKLNGILMCCDLWIEELEDADDQFLIGFVGDLQLIDSAAHRCVVLVDNLLRAWNMDDDYAEAAHDADDGLESISFSDWIPNTPNTADSAITGHVLIIDDDDINRAALNRHLTVQGHRVSMAADGNEGWEVLNEQSSVDIVLLDIMMPGISGFELLQRMKASEKLRALPVIMISALGEIEAVVKCIKAGADDYLAKPFNLVLLNARIRACLQRRRLEQEILKEKQRADELLGVILPEDIVAELKESDAVEPRRHEQIAVLFADIVNFTRFCEQHTPQQVLTLLQKLVVAWEESASRYRVEKIKTIGDAFMAAAGLNGETSSPVEDCVRCGIEMIEATRRLDVGWDLRVGVHVGPVVAGVLGKCKFAFDLWGDTVNTASRMESHGVAGSVVLTADAVETLFCDDLHAESLGCVPVKGKGPIETFRIGLPG